jgi:hypothetical protein
VAIDADGRKYAYSRKPLVFNDHYDVENPSLNDSAVFIEQVTPPDEFIKCLYERPMSEQEKAGLTRVYNKLQEMEKKTLKKQLQKIEQKNNNGNEKDL